MFPNPGLSQALVPSQQFNILFSFVVSWFLLAFSFPFLNRKATKLFQSFSSQVWSLFSSVGFHTTLNATGKLTRNNACAIISCCLSSSLRLDSIGFMISCVCPMYENACTQYTHSHTHTCTYTLTFEVIHSYNQKGRFTGIGPATVICLPDCVVLTENQAQWINLSTWR